MAHEALYNNPLLFWFHLGSSSCLCAQAAAPGLSLPWNCHFDSTLAFSRRSASTTPYCYQLFCLSCVPDSINLTCSTLVFPNSAYQPPCYRLCVFGGLLFLTSVLSLECKLKEGSALRHFMGTHEGLWSVLGPYKNGHRTLIGNSWKNTLEKTMYKKMQNLTSNQGEANKNNISSENLTQVRQQSKATTPPP